MNVNNIIEIVNNVTILFLFLVSIISKKIIIIDEEKFLVLGERNIKFNKLPNIYMTTFNNSDFLPQIYSKVSVKWYALRV